MQKFATELWHFILKPQPASQSEKSSAKNNTSAIYNAIGLYFVVAVLLYLPVNGINKLIHYFFSIDLFKVRDKNMIHSLVGTNALLIVALIGPMVEETLFRLWLVLNKTNLFISSTLIFWYVINRINHYSIFSGKINERFFYNVVIALVIAATLFFVSTFFNLKNIFKNNFRWFYWGSSILFGLIHILNFSPINYSIIWFYPFFILPQLFLGFILGFLRIKSGFYWALLLHCLVNLPGAIHLFSKL